MLDRPVGTLTEKAPQPSDAFSFDDVIRIDQPLDSRYRSHVPADDNRRAWRMHSDQAAHLAHLRHIHDDAAETDDVVRMRGQFADETRPGWKVEHRTGRRDVPLQEHQTPGAMKHAQREWPLFSRHLIVIELNRIDGATAVLVVLGKRFED